MYRAAPLFVSESVYITSRQRLIREKINISIGPDNAFLSEIAEVYIDKNYFIFISGIREVYSIFAIKVLFFNLSDQQIKLSIVE